MVIPSRGWLFVVVPVLGSFVLLFFTTLCWGFLLTFRFVGIIFSVLIDVSISCLV